MNIKSDSILFIRPDTYGDLVLFEPVLRGMKKAWPKARIGVLIQERYKDITTLMPAGITWIGTSCHPYRGTPAQCHGEMSRLRKVLTQFAPNTIVSACFNKTWLDAVVTSWFPDCTILSAGTQQQMDAVTTALLRADFGINASDMFRTYVAMEQDSSELTKNMALLAHLLAKDVRELRPVLSIPDTARKWAAEWLAAQGMTPGKFIACCPSGTANVRIKKWPAERYAAVLSQATQTNGMKAVLLGHVSEFAEIKAVQDECSSGCATWLGHDGEIAKLAAIIDLSHFYLGNDTGAMHIAAALGKPTIAIFGGGTWPRFRPEAKSFINVVQPLPCFKCGWICVFGPALCVEGIPTASVIAAIDEIVTNKSVTRDLHVDPCFSAEALAAFQMRESDRAANLKEIGKRDGWLSELQEVNEQALRLLPLVSIITPVFNGSKWIENCIQSVMGQDYPKIEHIIVDGGSTDGTLEFCSRYPHLIVHTKKDRGQSHAINKGFSMAQGDILAWLCGDNEYEPGAVQAAVKGIIAGHDVVMGYSRFIDAKGNVIGDHPANIYDHFDHAMFLCFWKYGMISQPATFWTRKMWDTCGSVKENLFFAMDYDLWLRMSKKAVFHRIDTYVAKYRLHADAKCLEDHYGSRIELIDVSKHYWPAKWKIKYWSLLFLYLFSRGGNTKHYADAERLLNSAIANLDNHKRIKAISNFIASHFVHFATPLMSGYKTILKRILGEGIGPLWFWHLAKRFFYALTLRKKIVLSSSRKLTDSGTAIIFNTESIGYRRPQFKYWAKSGEDVILLRDWRSQSTYVIAVELINGSNIGVHVRSGNKGEWQDQAWIMNERWE